MTKKVKFKDGMTGDILHPETEWGLVKSDQTVSTSSTDDDYAISFINKNVNMNFGIDCFFNAVGNIELNAEAIKFSTNGNIYLSDSNTNGANIALKDYPLSGNALSSTNLGLFGVVVGADPLTTYPAFRIKITASGAISYHYYFLDSNGVIRTPSSGMRFIPLTGSTEVMVDVK